MNVLYQTENNTISSEKLQQDSPNKHPSNGINQKLNPTLENDLDSEILSAFGLGDTTSEDVTDKEVF
jgi:hypothetical protein